MEFEPTTSRCTKVVLDRLGTKSILGVAAAENGSRSGSVHPKCGFLEVCVALGGAHNTMSDDDFGRACQPWTPWFPKAQVS